MSGSITEVGGDLSAEARLDDVDFYLGDPYPTYARLRAEAPVFWCESGEFWVLSRHEDVVWVEAQPNPPFTATRGQFIPEAAKPSRADHRHEQAGAAFVSDPPGHTRFRRLISSAFSPTRVTTLEPRIRSIASELLDQLPVGEEAEFVEAVSVPLSIQVVAELLGTSREDWENLRRWTDSFMLDLGGGFPEGSEDARRAMQDRLQIHEYFARSLAERRTTPRDDLMTTITSLVVDGAPLPEETQVGICTSVLIAGNDTTRNTLSGAMVAFAQHPEQWATLLAQPQYLENATEELLRWVTPVNHFGRRVTEPVTIRDQTMAEGDFVVMLYASANRDEDVWPDGDTFDVTRPIDRRQLSFGWGLHRCIGAGLARAEIRAVVEGMRERFGGWELSGSPERHPSTVVNDYRRVPITFTGAGSR
jgi:cytochrome P450